MKQQELFYTIQQLSKKLEIPKPTLRFWEKELCGHIKPLRTRGGQRRYTSEHVAIIEEIKKLREEGASLVEIKRNLGNGNKGEFPPGDIDLFAQRVAEVVKKEVYNFFVDAEN